MGLSERIREEVARRPGLTDRELTTLLFSADKHPSQVNQECRLLEQAGVLIRRSEGGVLRSYPTGIGLPAVPEPEAPRSEVSSAISEDDVKRDVKAWLEAAGWEVGVKWGREPGIDIVARRGTERWIIEAKGSGSLSAMRVNYFISMLGETLQRMNDPAARYSIALPDVPQFRGLWRRLPALAKSRTGISMLFVDQRGTVSHLAD